MEYRNVFGVYTPVYLYLVLGGLRLGLPSSPIEIYVPIGLGISVSENEIYVTILLGIFVLKNCSWPFQGMIYRGWADTPNLLEKINLP